ncbi:aminopeptidase N, partial [Nocardia sp. NPDC058497]
MPTANLTRSETAARSAAVTVHDYRVELDLSGARDQDRAGFATTTTVTFDATTAQTWLDFLGLAVESVTVNGQQVDVEYDGARLTLGGLSATNVVVVRATGEYSRSGEGLHRFLDPVDSATYLYT